MIYIFGISGKAGSGKDTLTDFLAEYLEAQGFAVHRIAFAYGVKEFGVRYFGDICDPVKKDDVSRKVLQGIGQMFRDQIDVDFWVDQAAKRMEHIALNNKGSKIAFFLTDVRYPNEVESFSFEYPMFHGVTAQKTFRILGRTSLTGVAAEHPSETALDELPPEAFDRVYENTGTLENLFEAGLEWLKEVINDSNK